MDKARLISFLRVQTDKPPDTILEFSNGNMSEHTKNFNLIPKIKS